MRFKDTSQSLFALPLALNALQTERIRVTMQKKTAEKNHHLMSSLDTTTPKCLQVAIIEAR
jgi:hypothetical protein